MTLETYLKTATKGLYGRKKLEVKTEIEGNIKELALEYQIAGLSEQQAISQAILDFGEARVLNAGMLTVHTMPKIFKAVLLAGLLSSVALVGVSSSLAEILTSSVGPYPTCPEDLTGFSGFCSSSAAWMKLSDFAADVTKAGAIFTRNKTSFTVTFPNDQAIVVPFKALPDSTIGSATTVKGDIYFEKSNESWISLTYAIFFQIAQKSKLNVTLEGWENLKLHVGETTLKIVTENDVNRAFEIYANSVLMDVFRRGLEKQFSLFHFNPPVIGTQTRPKNALFANFKHQISVSDKPGTIYAVLTQDENNLVSLSIAPVASDGTITLWLENSRVNFVDTLEKLDPHLRIVESPAVLVKLSGRLDTKAPKLEVVVPAITKSSAKF